MKKGKKFYWRFLMTALLLIFAGKVGYAAELDLEKRVKEVDLKNGMKILMLERHQSPTISLFMAVKAGAVDEITGYTGLAHLLEHMLFKGTKTIGVKDYAAEKKIIEEIDRVAPEYDRLRIEGEKKNREKIEALRTRLKELQDKENKLIIKDEIHAIYARNGERGFNAGTGFDLTVYNVSLPANRLELWAGIESDRMKNPVFREIYLEREVAREERRQSYESQPRRKLWEQFLAAAYTAHPYGIPIIGWDSDIKFLERHNVEEFFKSYYAPNNTVVAIVGDIDPAETEKIMRTYFEGIPPQVLPRPLSTREPEQKGERRIKLRMDAAPFLIVGFHKPNQPHREDYAFDIIEALLSEGRTSRFYQNLVEKKMALSATATNGYPGARYPNLFCLTATPQDPHTAEELESAIYRELERLKKELITEKEIQKIKNRLRADLIWSLSSNRGMASQLSYYQTVTGDWRYMINHLKVIETITPEEIRKAANRYLTKDNRTVAILEKKEKVTQNDTK